MDEDLTPPAAATEALIKTSLHSFGFKSAHHAQCPICGDQITGNHYGVNTCESCKGFFKRTKKSKTQLKCVNGSNSCPMSIEGRKLCSKCRYDKCLAVGMSEGVKSRLVAGTGGKTSTEDDGESPMPSSSSSSMMTTRTRTIKRRFIDYGDEYFDAQASKRPNTRSPEPKQDGTTSESSFTLIPVVNWSLRPLILII